ncbi:MAG: hypothetical protein ACKVS7_11985 [Gemmatimonadaceae bacterium]
MHITPLAYVAFGAALLSGIVACGDSPTQYGANGPSAYVSLVLAYQNGGLDSAGATGTATISDVLLPYGVRYREVDDFRMTRRGDVRLFDWVEVIPGRRSALDNTFNVAGNWALRWTGRAGRLGLRDVLPGDTLDFTVETGNRSIVAMLIVPGVPRLSHARENGLDVVRWRRVPGAAYYEVFAPSESDEMIYTSDSSLAIINRQGQSSAPTVLAQVHDPGSARRRLSPFSFPESQDGVRYQFTALTSDRITVPR